MNVRREKARAIAAAAVSRRGWSDSELARVAGLDVGTVSDFLAGSRWPRRQTLAKLDVALGWDAGSLDGIGTTGRVPDSVAPSDSSWRELREVPDVELLAEVARRMARPTPAAASDGAGCAG